MNRGEQQFPFTESYDVLMKARNGLSDVWLHKIYKEMKALYKIRSDPIVATEVLNELLRRYPINKSELHSHSLQDRMIAKLCKLRRVEIEAYALRLGFESICMEIEQGMVNYIARKVTLTEELVSQTPKQILEFICDHRRAEIAECEHPCFVYEGCPEDIVI